MTDHGQSTAVREDLAEEDVLRADLYSMLARFLARAPSQDTIDAAADRRLEGIEPAETPDPRVVSQFRIAHAPPGRTALG